MAAEFEDNYGDQNIDIDVKVVVGPLRMPFLSVILTKVQTTDDFVDAFTYEPAEIEAFFAAVRQAEAEYRRLTVSE
jgi:hypothetical protein